MTPVQKKEAYKAHTALVPFDELNEPGAYLANWSGHLIRIPDDGLKPGRSPAIGIRGPETMMVSKLSDDPFITLTKARLIAADLDLDVNF